MKDLKAVFISDMTHRKLKLYCALKDASMSIFVNRVVEKWLDDNEPEISKKAEENMKG
jgi:hypothetical protein